MTEIISKNAVAYFRGRELFEEGDYLVALDELQRSAIQTSHFKTYETIGECLLALGRPAESALYFSAAAGLGNKQFRAWFLLATALVQINDLVGARTKLEQALILNSNYKAARELLAEINNMQIAPPLE